MKTDTHTAKTAQYKRGEIGIMYLQTKECQGLLATTRKKLKRSKKGFYPVSEVNGFVVTLILNLKDSENFLSSCTTLFPSQLKSSNMLITVITA